MGYSQCRSTATTTQFVRGTGVKTVTGTVTSTFNGTETKTVTATMTGSGTSTGTATVTVTATQTTTGTNGGAGGKTFTATGTATGTAMQSWTYHQTLTITSTVTTSSSSTVTGTKTATSTLTTTTTPTATNTSTATATSTATLTKSTTATSTVTSTETVTATGTLSTSSTVTSTSTANQTQTVTNTTTNTGTATLTTSTTHTTTSTATATATEQYQIVDNIDCGTVAVGLWMFCTATVKNTAGQPEPPPTTLTLDGTPSISLTSVVDAASCLALNTLDTDQTCTFKLQFMPTEVGTVSSNVSLSGSVVQAFGTGVQKRYELADAATFGQVVLGESATTTIRVHNISGQPQPAPKSVVFEGLPGFSVVASTDPASCLALDTLDADQWCKLTIQFAPTALGTINGNVLLEGDLVGGIGTGIAPSYGLPSGGVDCGTVAVGLWMFCDVPVTNTSGQPEPAPKNLTVDGSPSFSLSSFVDATSCLGLDTLSTGQTCSFKLQFAPTDVGMVSANVSLNGSVAPVSGTGVQKRYELADAATFGRVMLGESATTTIRVHNLSGQPQPAPKSLVFEGLPGFSVVASADPASCLALAILDTDQWCKFTIQFAPTALGTVNGTVLLEGDLAGGIGTGVTPYELLGAAFCGTVALAHTMFCTVTVRNDASVPEPAPQTLTLEGPAGFSLVGNTGGTSCIGHDTLESHDMCTFKIAFMPTVVGQVQDTAAVDGDYAGAVAVIGTGIEQRYELLSGVVFGQVPVGAVAERPITVRNISNQTQPAPKSVTLEGPTSFTIQVSSDGYSCLGLDTLNPGDMCTFALDFAPTTPGSVSATVSLEGDFVGALATGVAAN